MRMVDGIYVANLPAGADAYGGYVNGMWPTYQGVVAKFPAARHLSIAVSADAQADCLDVETGDASNSQAPGWFARWRPGNTSLPVFYTAASNITALVNTLAKAGIPRSRYLIWSAHYWGGLHVCAPAVCGYAQADGTQWATSNAFDTSELPDSFFTTSQPKEADMPLTQQDIDAVAAAVAPAVTNAVMAAIRQLFVQGTPPAPNGELFDRVRAAAVAGVGQQTNSIAQAVKNALPAGSPAVAGGGTLKGTITGTIS